MGRRKCTPKQLAALRRGREIAHRRSKKNTKSIFGNKLKSAFNRAKTIARGINAFNKAISPYNKPKIPLNKTTPIPAPIH